MVLKLLYDSLSERRPSTATFHKILSFQDGTNRYLRTLKKGSKVFVEANFELREPEAGADPATPQGQRQILLRHGKISPQSQPIPLTLIERFEQNQSEY